MALASGLALVGGAEGNDPIAASTYGTGELIAAAVDAGAQRVLVGVGGSATTDGGLGALRALHPLPALRGVELVVACDVRTRFVDAADVFAPQKGATAGAGRAAAPPARAAGPGVRRGLRRRRARAIDGGGAAGGLAGGLAAVGAELVEGFEVVADEVDLYGRIEGADLVITGEGFLDAQSFEGKVVGGVAGAGRRGRGAGRGHRRARSSTAPPTRIEAISLVERFGEERARGATRCRCIEEVAARAARPPR